MPKSEFCTQSQLKCPICNSRGNYLYYELTDKLYHVPGKWNFIKCNNNSCGTVWLSPIIVEKDLKYAYHDYHTHFNAYNGKHKSKIVLWLEKWNFEYIKYKYHFKYNCFNLIFIIFNLIYWIHPFKKNFHERYKFYKAKNKDSKLLDFGCGNGSFLLEMKQLGWQVEGIDFDKNALEIARKKKLKVYSSDIKDINYSENLFDLIVLNNVLEHIYNIHDLFSGMYKILKPGGRILINTPNISSISHRIFKKNWRGLEPPRHIQIMTPKSLKLFLLNHGFKIEKLFCGVQSTYVVKKSYLLKKNKDKLNIIENILLNIITLFYAQMSFFLKNSGDMIVITAKK